MKNLRQYIRKIILEVYDLKDEEIHTKQELERNYGSWGKKLAKAKGLQNRDEQISDREALKIYQQNLHADPEGKKLINAFRQGDITVLHSFEYGGATKGANMGGSSMEKLASDWVKKYGKTGNDSLSVCAYFEPVTSSIGTKINLQRNARFVAQARGVILKGYPVFVGERDLMTQTLGAMSDSMKDHWRQSGVPKRPSAEKGDHGGFLGMTKLRRLLRVGYSDETILDNWTVVGTYINSVGKTDEEIDRFVEDSLSIGLPCNVYDPKGKLLERYEP